MPSRINRLKDNLQDVVDSLISEAGILGDVIEEKDTEITHLSEKIAEFEEQLKEKDEKIAELDEKILLLEQELIDLKSEITEE